MAENDLNFQENVKNAFNGVKNDISRLDSEIFDIKKDINEVKENILSLKEEISKIIPFLEKLSIKQPEKVEEISTGNKGVLSKQASKQAVKHLNTKQLSTLNDLQADIKEQFKLLTKQEFLTFLTIYQLDEELEIVRFIDVSKRLKLSESCIRAYVTRLLEKNMPIVKKRINNRIVNLSLLPEFRSLDLKKPLTNMYYDLDPLQKSLEEPY